MNLDTLNSRRTYPSARDSEANLRQGKVCFHWRAGRCNRFPCPFLHGDLPVPASKGGYKRAVVSESAASGPRKNNSSAIRLFGNNKLVKTERVCNYWVQGSCSFGDNCKFLHAWNVGDCFSMLTKLEGHQKVVNGIALPFGSDKLYTGSKDEMVRVWDCQSGKCLAAINVGAEVGCMISEGPWVFVGTPNTVKAWNTQTNTDLSLSGPVGQVYALVVGNDLLIAGMQDAAILAWKFNTSTCNFDPAASFKGHTMAVVSLVVGTNKLYSGSMDHSIRVWNLETCTCLQTLIAHTSVVMSVLCWDQYLLSCSLDQTIKVWAAKEGGMLDVAYTHTEENGLLVLCGMHDPGGKPILLCASNDNTLRLFDLPSFSERGKIFSKREIRAVHVAPGSIFFTGDATGQVTVWKFNS